MKPRIPLLFIVFIFVGSLFADVKLGKALTFRSAYSLDVTMLGEMCRTGVEKIRAALGGRTA